MVGRRRRWWCSRRGHRFPRVLRRRATAAVHRGVVNDFHGGLVDVQRMDDLQLGPGRRMLRRGGRGHRLPAGDPQELLDLQAHLARFAVLLLLVRGPLATGQRERGRLTRGHRVAAGHRVRLFAPAVAVPGRRRRLFLLDLLAVLGQQLPVGHGHVVRPELVVRQRTVRAVVHDRGRLGAALAQSRRRRGRRLRGLPFDAPGTLGRAVAANGSLKTKTLVL